MIKLALIAIVHCRLTYLFFFQHIILIKTNGWSSTLQNTKRKSLRRRSAKFFDLLNTLAKRQNTSRSYRTTQQTWELFWPKLKRSANKVLQLHNLSFTGAAHDHARNAYVKAYWTTSRHICTANSLLLVNIFFTSY